MFLVSDETQMDDVMVNTRSRRPQGVEYRRRADGTTGYRVPWREGGQRDGGKRSRTFDTVHEAVQFRGALVANGFRDPYEDPEWAAHLGVVPAAAKVKTYRDVFREYLATLVDTDRRTVAEYETAFDNHINAAVVVLPDGRAVGPLGRMAVDRHDRDVVQAWVNHMRTKTYGKKVKRTYSAKTIINIHGSVISPVFDYAVDRGYIPASPCRGVKLPERKGRTVKLEHIVDEAEAPAWIDCAYEVDEDTGDITATILGTGVRWGELIALRPCDVNAQARTLSIMQVVKEDENRQPYICTLEGKSANAFRTIALGPEALRILLARAKGKKPKDLLFPPPGTRGGKIWRNAHFNTARWKKVKKLAAERGLMKDPHPHSLRHSHATALIPLHGIESVSKRIGHGNVTVTSGIYSHLIPETDARMAESAEGLLMGKKPRRLRAVA
ncbi:site-specific integrase [Streptomyces sp. AV19]|uniref:tyrosine-type recombinase/integrase n=1 Tax=Streptomyces sp. AV19 TaxID=2793068 RepID=UPI0018FE20DD|nr:site-specific integrase [Streptomyces sp. AV19]MBH1932759.1 site-specific integrase [Streptomyces sp. AV19]